MLPIIEGTIARRVLLNFRADPIVVQRLVPEPLQVQRHSGSAIVGVCLIRFEHLRPTRMPKQLGISTENMAHRVAVLYPTDQGIRPGVYIWRRETNSAFVACTGGKIFPGVHSRAHFDVVDDGTSLTMDVKTGDSGADVAFQAYLNQWTPSASFGSFNEVSDFFCQGSCGYSTAGHGRSLEGLELRTNEWHVDSLNARVSRVSFFENKERFPPGSVEFDCALIMRNVGHSWREIDAIERRIAV